MESTLREYNSPRKFVANTWQHLPHLLNSWNCSSSSECRNSNHFVSVKLWYSVSGMIVRRSIKCKQWPVYGGFWPLLPQPSSLPIVTKHELGLPFPPRNLRIKFGTSPSTIFLIIVVTDRHTDRHTHRLTPVKTYFLAFAGRIICMFKTKIMTRWNKRL